MTARAVGLALGLAAYAVAAVPAAASTAALVHEEPIPGLESEPAYSLTVEGAAGEANTLTVTQDPDGYTVHDASAPVHPGTGCEAVDPSTARCSTPESPAEHSALVSGRDGADAITVEALPAATFLEVRGGAGADVIRAGPGRDLLHGGAGADSIAGAGGNDRLDGGRGDDLLDGGEGIDRVLYEARRVPVRVDLAAGTGGSAGEADTITAVEEVMGGHASDTLAGDGLPNIIIGGLGDGRDTVLGRGGNDNLRGHRVRGGPGDDSVGGRIVSCGSGRDMVSRGPGHWLRGPFAAACETVLALFVVLEPDPLMRSARRAVFSLGCRAPRCSGTLELSDRRGRLARKRFSVEQGADPAALHPVAVRLRRRPASRTAELHVRGPRAYQRDWFRTRLR